MDRPILFSAPMVRALLDGRKTQTRRTMMTTRNGTPAEMHPSGRSVPFNDPDQWGFPYYDRSTDSTDIMRLPDYAKRLYAVGDRLYVREAWRCNGWAADLATIFYRASEGDGYTAMCEQYPVAGKRPMHVTAKWRPGIHMPRWASRLSLIVTDVRVQRLQEISEEDAVAEGISPLPLGLYFCGHDDEGEITCKSPVTAFGWLWNGLNAARGFAWDANPWVVAVTFTVERGNIDEVPA